jgi:hypothetical protein
MTGAVMTLSSMLGRLVLEAAPAFVVERERDDVAVDRIGVRASVDEILTRDDRLGIEHVEFAIALIACHQFLRTPLELLTRGNDRPDGRRVQRRRECVIRLNRHDVLARDRAARHVRGEQAGARRRRRRRGGTVGLGRRRIRPEERRNADRTRRVAGGDPRAAADARRLGGLIETCQHPLKRLGAIGDLELQERGFGDDRLGAFRIIDAGQLDHESVSADLLHHRLGDAELIDALTDHLQGAIERLRLVCDRLLGLVDLERQMHAALQVETLLEGDAPDGVVDEHAVTLDTLDDSSRKECPRRNEDTP